MNINKNCIDLVKLKALAQEVKGWSNCDTAWAGDDGTAMVGAISEDDDEPPSPVAVIDCAQYDQADHSLKLAQFYAAANPATVLQLIAMIEATDK